MGEGKWNESEKQKRGSGCKGQVVVVRGGTWESQVAGEKRRGCLEEEEEDMEK